MWSSVQYWLRTCDASAVITQPQSVLKPSFSSTDLNLQADTSNSQSQPLVQITFSEPFFTLLCFDVLAFLITAVCWGAEAHTSPDVNDTWNHAACWVVCYYLSEQSDYLFIYLQMQRQTKTYCLLVLSGLNNVFNSNSEHLSNHFDNHLECPSKFYTGKPSTACVSFKM